MTPVARPEIACTEHVAHPVAGREQGVTAAMRARRVSPGVAREGPTFRGPTPQPALGQSEQPQDDEEYDDCADDVEEWVHGRPPSVSPVTVTVTFKITPA